MERASHDLKSVITTYEGKHNHDVPAARNSSSQANAATSGTVATQASSANAIHSLRAEPSHSQVHNSIARPALGLGSFNLPGPGPGGRQQQQQLGPPHAFSFGMGMNQLGFPNLTAMAALGHSQGQLPVMPIHPAMAPQRPPNKMGFMLPKGEPSLEPIPDRTGSSVYQEIMGRMPLGPHM